mgnify:CR=1 FL=1
MGTAAVVTAAGLTLTRIGSEMMMSTVSVGEAAVVTAFMRLAAAVMDASACFCFSAATLAAFASVAASFLASAAAPKISSPAASSVLCFFL